MSHLINRHYSRKCVYQCPGPQSRCGGGGGCGIFKYTHTPTHTELLQFHIQLGNRVCVGALEFALTLYLETP